MSIAGGILCADDAFIKKLQIENKRLKEGLRLAIDEMELEGLEVNPYKGVLEGEK